MNFYIYPGSNSDARVCSIVSVMRRIKIWIRRSVFRVSSSSCRSHKDVGSMFPTQKEYSSTSPFKIFGTLPARATSCRNKRVIFGDRALRVFARTCAQKHCLLE